MIFFPNEQLELYEYTESTTEFNSYLEPKKEYTLKTTVPCDFQPMSPNDQLREFGELLTDTYKIYIDPAVEVSPDMILKLTGKDDTYEIQGTPIDNNHLLPVKHQKIIVQKQRKPTKLNLEEESEDDQP